MSLYIKNAGSWKNINKIFVKDANLWKTVSKGWIKDGGVWKQFFSSAITITGTRYNINLRNEFNQVYPGQTPTGTVQFIVDNALIGSSSTSNYALVTGNWPGDVTLILTINSNSIIAGAGGAGGIAQVSSTTWNGYAGPGRSGGAAINLNYNLTLNNSGIVGGGGGGGGGAMFTFTYNGGFAMFALGGGGGGAGINGGVGTTTNCTTNCNAGVTGSTQIGGTGGSFAWTTGGLFRAIGGTGGNLGQGGTAGTPANGYVYRGSNYSGNIERVYNVGASASGGSAGAAIVRGGFTLTGTTGDIRGAIT
jgi:hypothetical protein